MRATEIIRSILDLIDHIDIEKTDQQPQDIDTDDCLTPLSQPDDVNRFRQIFDLLSAEKNQTYDNSPDVVVAGIESVTSNAGGGWNGPKNPSDLRADSVSMYPNHQHRPE